MAKKKIKTNHPFTKAQLEALNKELDKISNAEIVALRGSKIPSLKSYADIEVLHTPYLLDVFLSFMDISDPSNPKSMFYQIDSKGNVDKDARRNMKFNNLSDRVSFFNSLEKIKFD